MFFLQQNLARGFQFGVYTITTVANAPVGVNFYYDGQQV